MISQPLRSTPTAGLGVVMGWLPLHMHAKEIGLNSFMRTKNVIPSRWDGIGNRKMLIGHRGLWSKKLKEVLPDNYPIEHTFQCRIWKEEITVYQEERYPRIVYTDASVDKSDVGYGWLITLSDYVIKEGWSMAKDLNIFQAEILVIKEALDWLRLNPEREHSIKIYSDSQSAVLALNGNMAKNELLYQAMVAMEAIRKVSHLEILWAKGHSNLTGNEVPDMLAKRGSNNAKDLLYTVPFMPINNGVRKRLIHEAYLAEWNDARERIPSCRLPSVSTHMSGRTSQSLRDRSRTYQI